jgi:hypothetical protein
VSTATTAPNRKTGTKTDTKTAPAPLGEGAGEDAGGAPTYSKLAALAALLLVLAAAVWVLWR